MRLSPSTNARILRLLPPPLLLLLLLLLLLAKHGQSEHHTEPDRFQICLGDALCRNLYQQDHGALSRERFEQLSNDLPDVMRNANMTQLLADRMSLYYLAYNEARCPPNHFWRWDPETQEGRCVCYLERDCRLETVTLCEPEMHPILFACFVLIVGFQASLVITQNFCRDGAKPTKRHKRRNV